MKIRRARVVTLAPSGRVAMIERYVRGHRFLSVPGGRLEPGESPEQAALREIQEELGLSITLAGRLPDHEGQAYFLAVVPEETRLVMSGPEAKHENRNNRYTPRWVDAATLDGLSLRQPVRHLVTTASIAVAATMATVRPMVDVDETAAAGVPHSVVGDVFGEPTIDLTDPPLVPGPLPEFDPAAATFEFGQRIRRRFLFRRRDDHRSNRTAERFGVRR